MKTKQGHRYRCDARYGQTEGITPLELELEEVLLQWFSQVFISSLDVKVVLMSDVRRFWGKEFRYTNHLVCIRRGGVVQRKDTFVNAHKARLGPDSSEGSDNRANLQTLPSNEVPEEQPSDEDDFLVTWDNSSPDPREWSTHPLCVADPFILSKVLHRPYDCKILTNRNIELLQPDQSYCCH
jgi:Cid1 family poly A polymerase